jgi:hypothetical protein
VRQEQSPLIKKTPNRRTRRAPDQDPGTHIRTHRRMLCEEHAALGADPRAKQFGWKFPCCLAASRRSSRLFPSPQLLPLPPRAESLWEQRAGAFAGVACAARTPCCSHLLFPSAAWDGDERLISRGEDDDDEIRGMQEPYLYCPLPLAAVLLIFVYICKKRIYIRQGWAQ